MGGGFTNDDLDRIMQKITAAGYQCEVVRLEGSVPAKFQERDGFEKAHVLVIRDGARYCGCDAGAMLLEQLRPNVYDTKEYDHRFKNQSCKGAINLRARLKTVFEERSKRLEHSADYTQPSVNAFCDFPQLQNLKNSLAEKLSERCTHLNCDGNKYHHAGASMGWHGDAASGRHIIVNITLDDDPTRTRRVAFKWLFPKKMSRGGRKIWTGARCGNPLLSALLALPCVACPAFLMQDPSLLLLRPDADESEPIAISLKHGDMYIMSEKAAGLDCKKRSRVRLLHCAGTAADEALGE
jgi:hypothetical protein